MTKTQRGEYRFTIKDKEGDECWLFCEPTGVTLKNANGKDLQVGFGLAPGITRNEVESLAQAMNKAITHIVLF
jgi:hypothetical protein